MPSRYTPRAARRVGGRWRARGLPDTPPPSSATYYVSPAGTSGGDGSTEAPWSLAHALAGAGGVIAPGDTIEVSGTHTGTFTSTVTGTSSAPVTLRPPAGERWVIAGRLTVEGAYADLWHVEVDGATLAMAPGSTGINVFGVGVRLIHPYVHDCPENAIAIWSEAVGAECYGHICLANGFLNDGGAYAHGLYTQNASGTRRGRNGVILYQGGYGLHAYGSDEASLTGLTFEDNLHAYCGLGDGMPSSVGGATPLVSLAYRRNIDWLGTAVGAALRLGFAASAPGVSGVVEENVTRGKALVQYWDAIRFRGNRCIAGDDECVALTHLPAQDPGTYDWDQNTYHKAAGSTGSPFGLTEEGSAGVAGSFAQWQGATGLDGASDFIAALPVDPVIHLRPSTYDADVCHIVIEGWSGAASVPVNLEAAFDVGDMLAIYHVHDLSTPLVSGAYPGGAVGFPMGTVPPPTPAHTPPIAIPDPGTSLGAFVVRRTA